MFEFLYDNGVKETIKTAKLKSEEVISITNAIYNSFRKGRDGVIYFNDDRGSVNYISLRKITRFNWWEANEED